MEEVEQICTRIAIIDKGKNLAIGTKEELKQMIRTGETIHIQVHGLDKEELQQLQQLPHVIDLNYEDDQLTIRCSKGKHNLLRVLDFMREHDSTCRNVFAEQPTLNDVFLEITGKELRDL